MVCGCVLAYLSSMACAPQVITPVDGEPAADAGSSGATAGGAQGGASAAGAAAMTEAGAAGVLVDPTLRGDALLHRYGFDGVGSQAVDSKGAAHGELIATKLTGQGFVHLAAPDTTRQYVDLPNGLISGLVNATFEIWVNWDGGGDWQRIFDFGEDSTGVEGSQSNGRSYLFLSPHGNGDFLRAVYKNPMLREIIIDVRPALKPGALEHLALVFDDQHDLMSLYVNAELSGSVELDSKLSQIHDVNDWLGRSQFAVDSPFTGSIDELRIYDVALTAGEIRKSFEAGPDAVFPDP